MRGKPGSGTAPAGWTERWGAAPLTCTPPPRSTRRSLPGSRDSTGQTTCNKSQRRTERYREGGTHTRGCFTLQEIVFLYRKPSCTLRETSLVVQSGWMCWKSVMLSVWSLVFLQSERSAAWKRSAQQHTHLEKFPSPLKRTQLLLLLLTVPLYEHFPHRLTLTLRGREQGMLGDRRRGVGDDVILFYVQLIGKMWFHGFQLPGMTRVNNKRLKLYIKS